MTRGLDLGIAGRRAIVCAASKGLGRGSAMALARAGVDLVINARNAGPLEATAEAIRKETGVKVKTVAADVTTEEGRKALLAALPDPDILVNNAGGPPPGNFRDFGEAAWNAALRANMLTPIFLIQATIDAMIARKWGRIVNITSSSVKAPIPILGLSNGARSGLTGFVAGIAREVARHGVTINNLLPGSFDTDRLRSNIPARAKQQGISEEEAFRRLEAGIPAGRAGRADEFGTFCAFLASEHAAYMTGQNVLLDGGAYPGTF